MLHRPNDRYHRPKSLICFIIYFLSMLQLNDSICICFRFKRFTRFILVSTSNLAVDMDIHNRKQHRRTTNEYISASYSYFIHDLFHSSRRKLQNYIIIFSIIGTSLLLVSISVCRLVIPNVTKFPLFLFSG